VVLLDLMLMGMSGLDFLEQSQVVAKHPETKIVVLTNVDNPEIMDRVKAQGVAGYLVKASVEPATLGDYLQKLLAGEQTPGAAPAASTPSEPQTPAAT